MLTIATDGVASRWSVGLSVTTMSRAETAEPIVIPFGMWTRVGRRKYVLDGVQIPTRVKGKFEGE